MKSIREIYKTGKGPSSSHTMGPERAANYFKSAHPQADGFRVILYGSLSKTGVGHGTDRMLREVLAPVPTEIVFSDEALPASAHPNTMDLIALKNGAETDRLRVESIGGGDIRIPGGMPRIISDELFYDAQEAYGMKKDNRYGRARHGAENYLLTGKLYCGHCGGYMVGISGTSKSGEMHHYYACQKHRLEHTCEKKAIRRDVIENAVAQAIMMYCLDDETIDFIVDSTIAYFKQKDHELHIEVMENELAAVQQAISNLMKAIEAGIITSTTRTRLLDLEEQQAKLSAKINTAKAERVEIDRDDLIAGLQLFRAGDVKNKKFLAKLFNTFLIAVYLYNDNRLKIVFSFTGNHNSVEIPLELNNDCPDNEIVSDETEVRMSHLECGRRGSNPHSRGTGA